MRFGATEVTPPGDVPLWITMTGVFARPFWIGRREGAPGLLELAQLPLMDLEPGDTLVLERSIRVGARADVASVTDAYWPDGALLSGRVDEPAARIHVETPAGGAVTEVSPAADGSFSLRLPAGSYRLRAVAPGARELVREVALAALGLTLDPIALGATAHVTLPRGETMRLVFVGEEGTPNPRFGDDLLRFRVNGEEVPPGALTNAVSLANLPSDPSEVTLAPGKYRVLATSRHGACPTSRRPSRGGWARSSIPRQRCGHARSPAGPRPRPSARRWRRPWSGCASPAEPVG